MSLNEHRTPTETKLVVNVFSRIQTRVYPLGKFVLRRQEANSSSHRTSWTFGKLKTLLVNSRRALERDALLSRHFNITFACKFSVKGAIKIKRHNFMSPVRNSLPKFKAPKCAHLFNSQIGPKV